MKCGICGERARLEPAVCWVHPGGGFYVMRCKECGHLHDGKTIGNCPTCGAVMSMVDDHYMQPVEDAALVSPREIPARTPGAVPAGLPPRGRVLKFLVQLELAEDTRELATRHSIAEQLVFLAYSIGRLCTEGPEPRVTVIPEEAP